MFHQNNPRPRSNISAAWAHFTRRRNGLSAICNYCGADVACPSGSTSGMFSHLRGVHPTVYEKEQCIKNERYNFINSLISQQEMDVPTTLDNEDSIIQEEEEVHIKANDVYHLPKTIYPELMQVYKDLPSKKIYHDITGYDVILHCQNGLLSAHKLILGSGSPFLRSLFTWRDVDHLFLADFKVDEVSSVLESLYTGQVDLPLSSQHLATILGISLTVDHHEDDGIADVSVDVDDNLAEEGLIIKEDPESEIVECQVNMEDDIADPGPIADQPDLITDEPDMITDESDNFLQFSSPDVLQITDIRSGGGLPFHSLQQTSDLDLRVEEMKHRIFSECNTSPHSVNTMPRKYAKQATARGADLDRKVIEMKTRIFQECSRMKGVEVTAPRRKPTRLPSKIWKWFDKTPTTLTCLVCQAQLRNCGNTTNAAFHLKKHPTQYEKFKSESGDQNRAAFAGGVKKKPVIFHSWDNSKPNTAAFRNNSKPNTAAPRYNSKPNTAAPRYNSIPPKLAAAPRRNTFSDQFLVQKRFVKILPKPAPQSDQEASVPRPSGSESQESEEETRDVTQEQNNDVPEQDSDVTGDQNNDVTEQNSDVTNVLEVKEEPLE